MLDTENVQVATAVTNSQGKVSFTNVRPGAYTVCEVLQSGLTNEQPCRAVQVDPAQIANLTFANVVAGAAAATVDGTAVTIFAAPNVAVDEANYDVPATDDAWLNTDTLELTNYIYLPLVNQSAEESVPQQ